MKRRFGKINTGGFEAIAAAFLLALAIFAIMRFDTTGEQGSGLSKAYEYDISELAKVDPNLMLYEELGDSFETGFSGARAIAVGPGGLIYVAGDDCVRVFGESGSRVREFSVGAAVRCVAVGEDDRVFVALEEHIEIYDSMGKRLSVWDSLGEKAILTSVAVSKDDVFAADCGNRIVVRYDMDGKIVKRIGGKDKERKIPGFVIPTPYFDLLVAGDGLLRVVNPGRHTIEAYTFDGDMEISWGKFSSRIEGFTGCCNPVNIAMLADGSFITCEKGLVRVKVYDAAGEFVGVVASPKQLAGGRKLQICQYPAQCQVGGFDIAVDGKGRVLVLDTLRNVVRTFGRIEKGQ